MSDQINSISNLLSNKDLISLCKEYYSFKSKEFNVGFNVFQLVSDTYYKENFHSDIIKAFLDKNGNHKEGDKYLKLFLQFLNLNGAEIDITNYLNTSVSKEEGTMEDGFIDILIKNEDYNGKRAIIIENKIHDAIDQPRQLPKYVDYITNNGFEIDAIVYFSLDGNKIPSFSDWTKEEIDFIKKKLIRIGVYEPYNLKDIYNGWLKLCISETAKSNEDAICVLKQYGKLITNLKLRAMDYQMLEKFNEIVKNDDSLQTISSITKLYNDYCNYYIPYEVVKLYQKDHKPFDNILLYRDVVAVFDWQLARNIFAMTVDFHEDNNDNIQIRIFDRSNNVNGFDTIIKSVINKNGFEEQGLEFYRYFKFPEKKDDFYKFLNNFISDLKSIKLTD